MLFNLIKGNMTFTDVIVELLVMLLIIFIVLPVHEFAHAGVAYLLGDKDIKRRNRLTLNPLSHIDPFGSLCMLLFGFGWAKPVPIDPSNFKRPKLYMALTALAGPVSNLLCAMLGGVVLVFLSNYALRFAFSTVGSYVVLFLFYYVTINISLAVFNLIPIPPLDGSKVLYTFLPRRAIEFISRYENYSFIVLYALLFSGLLDKLLNDATMYLFDLCIFFSTDAIWVIYYTLLKISN